MSRILRSMGSSSVAVLAATSWFGCANATSDAGGPSSAGLGGNGGSSGTGLGGTGGAGAGGVNNGGTTTGGSATGGTGTGGASTGGAATGGTGGVSNAMDCSGITTAGYQVCASTSTSCDAVFTNGAGCTAVCAAAGLACASAAENVDGVCAANDTVPALPCDSGHQSDYCRCSGPYQGTGGTGGSGGTGGTDGASGTGGASTGGTSGTGGTSTGGTGGTPDCNSITNQPILAVAKSGAQFTTLQAAVNSLSTSNTTPTQIRIAPGTYKEKLVINRPFITLCGQAGQASSTILTYSDNANTSNGNGGTLGTSGGASTNLSAHDVSAENITFENSTPLGGSQAVALLVTGTKDQFRNCRFMSYQDTLYVKSGTQYFRDCYVQGTVDYIFGAATAVLDNCTAYNASGGTAVTAPNTDQSVPYGIVFLGGQLTASSNVSSNSMALGRNWGAYGSTTYIRTMLGAHISGVGWVPMGSNTLATARFAEYQTTGPGAKPTQRAPESTQLTASQAAAYTVSNIFSGSWIPSFSQ